MARRVVTQRRQRRSTQWLPNITQVVQTTQVASGVIATPILHTEAQLLTLGRKPTFTRFIGHLDVMLSAATSECITHCAMVIGPNLETASFDPTIADDLEMNLVVWQKQFALSNVIGAASGNMSIMRMDLDVKAQRIIKPNWDVVMLIEPNGATIEYALGGRSLFKLA